MSWPPVVDRPSMAPSLTDQILGLPSQPSSVVPSNSLTIVPVPAGGLAGEASGGAASGSPMVPTAPPVAAPPVPGLPPVASPPPVPDAPPAPGSIASASTSAWGPEDPGPLPPQPREMTQARSEAAMLRKETSVRREPPRSIAATGRL